jgi:hypothetical protein
MQVSIRTIAVTALVALLVPVAAVAKDARVTGPSALVGAGYFGGELELAMAAGQRPVKIAARAGYIGVLDLGGDLRIRCLGTGRVQKQETPNGMVYRCAGRQGGQVILLGSHFTFRGFAAHYRALLPTGASGSFHGRFVACAPAAEASSCRAPKPDVRQAEPKEPGQQERGQQERPKPADDEEIPSLDELAGMLADV